MRLKGEVSEVLDFELELLTNLADILGISLRSISISQLFSDLIDPPSIEEIPYSDIVFLSNILNADLTA